VLQLQSKEEVVTMKKIQKERRCATMDDEANPHHPPWVAPGNADDDVNMD